MNAQRWLNLIVVFALAIVLAVAYGCADLANNCGGTNEVPTFRCDGGKAEICRDAGWQLYRDCGSIGKTCSVGGPSCGGWEVACCE